MPIFATSNHTTRLITPPPTTIQQNAATTLALTMAALCESNARCSAQSYVLPDGTSPAKAKTFMEYMQEHTSAGFASAFHSGKLKDWETHKTKFTSLANEFLEREVLLPLMDPAGAALRHGRPHHGPREHVNGGVRVRWPRAEGLCGGVATCDTANESHTRGSALWQAMRGERAP